MALIGLISVQVYLLIVTYNEKEQAFDRNVVNALTAVSQQLEKNEAASKIFTVAMEMPSAPRPGAVKKLQRFVPKDSGKKGSSVSESFSWIITDTLPDKKGNQMRVEVFHSSGVDTLISMKAPGSSFGYSYSTDDRRIRINTTSNDSQRIFLRDSSKRRRGEIVSQVVDKLFLVETLPLEKRVHPETLDSLIGEQLSAVGIALPYTFRIVSGHHDSVKLAPPDSGVSLTGEPFSARLFPNDLLSPRYELLLFLPDKPAYLFRQITAVLVLSLLFMLLIIASFVHTIRIIMYQKRFSVSVIDFINNMTHEFKTPISTIALAAEAIAKPDVVKSKPKVLRYNTLIAAENNRMKHQVDKILQLAVLEEGEFEWKRSDVDMHAVITQAVQHVSMQAEQKNGKITVRLTADRAVVSGDAVHLANIIYNVLDNAIKYTPTVPAITVTSEISGSDLLIRVSDNGIGIPAQDLDRVFEKYFRVSTGNTHDVKGFGLGLRYVQLIVRAHGGTVSLASTPGAGTTVTIALPLRTSTAAR